MLDGLSSCGRPHSARNAAAWRVKTPPVRKTTRAASSGQVERLVSQPVQGVLEPDCDERQRIVDLLSDARREGADRRHPVREGEVRLHPAQLRQVADGRKARGLAPEVDGASLHRRRERGSVGAAASRLVGATSSSSRCRNASMARWRSLVSTPNATTCVTCPVSSTTGRKVTSHSSGMPPIASRSEAGHLNRGWPGTDVRTSEQVRPSATLRLRSTTSECRSTITRLRASVPSAGHSSFLARRLSARRQAPMGAKRATHGPLQLPSYARCGGLRQAPARAAHSRPRTRNAPCGGFHQ